MPADRLINEAIKTRGWSDCDNTKKTKVHEWYEAAHGGTPDPNKFAWDWCTAWISYVADKAGLRDAVTLGEDWVSAPKLANAFKAKGLWHDGADGIARGDIVFFDWHDGKGIEHVGIALGPVEAKTSTLPTIEGNTLNTVDYRHRKPSDIAGYGRPVYGGILKPGAVLAKNTTGKPEPVITPKQKEALVSTTVIFEDLGPRGTVAANKVVQAALDKFHPDVAVDGIYGPQTKAAYALWQRHLGYSGSDADGLPGWTSASRLAAQYGFHLAHRSDAPVPTPTPTPAGDRSIGNYAHIPEPAGNYTRVTYGGKKVNIRTRDLLNLASGWLGVTQLNLTQGSYNTGVSASAGTHDGGGVVDVNVDGWSSSRRSTVVQALRKAGFAAWLRTPAQGFAYHIHACAIGDREMAGLAREQVQSYFNGRNGLASNGSTEGETHWPDWADKYNQ